MFVWCYGDKNLFWINWREDIATSSSVRSTSRQVKDVWASQNVEETNQDHTKQRTKLPPYFCCNWFTLVHHYKTGSLVWTFLSQIYRSTKNSSCPCNFTLQPQITVFVLNRVSHKNKNAHNTEQIKHTIKHKHFTNWAALSKALSETSAGTICNLWLNSTKIVAEFNTCVRQTTLRAV